MKQTAVEFLEEKFNKKHAQFINWPEDYFNEAKEMEKQQIINACKYSVNGNILSEQYYNETFNNLINN